MVFSWSCIDIERPKNAAVASSHTVRHSRASKSMGHPEVVVVASLGEDDGGGGG